MRNIIFDWKRTLYDPDTKELIEGALDLLKYLKSHHIPMILVGKGGKDMNDEVKRLRVEKYFKKIIFAEGEKDSNVYVPHISKENYKKTLFIGDRVKSELEIGNELGAITIWVKQGKFAKELPENEDQEPDYTVASLNDCLSLLKGLI